MNKNSDFIVKYSDKARDEVNLPNSEKLSDVFGVRPQLEQAAARIKILSAQIAMERPEIHPSGQIAECAAARMTQTAEQDNLTGKKSTTDQTAPVKEYDFVAAAKFCEAEHNRRQRKIHRKPFNIPKYRKDVKPPMPTKRPKPAQSQRYSDDDVIEMVLKPGSGVNGPPIYTPEVSQSPYCMKRPTIF